MRKFMLPALVLVLSLSASGCGETTRRAPLLVADAATASTKGVLAIGQAISGLEKAQNIATPLALGIQRQLLSANTRLEGIVPILVTIQKAQEAGQVPALSDIERALNVLQAVSPDLSTLLVGVPVSEATKVLIGVVQNAQKLINTVMVEVATLKGRTEQ